MAEPQPSYEIDHGEEPPRRSAPPAPASAPASAPAPAASAGDARAVAVAQIARAERGQHIIDMQAAGLAGLCGQGVTSLGSVEGWPAEHLVGVLAALAGLAAAAFMWRRARAAAEALLLLPVPLETRVLRRLDADGAEAAESELRRQERDIAAVELQSLELDLLRHRLLLALYGAAGGAVCGWLAGLFGPPGTMSMCASAAALAAAVLAWRIAGGGWPLQRIHAALAAPPAAAAILALWCGTPVLAVLGAAAVAAAAIWRWRGRVVAACELPAL